jgi:dTDP-4-amino-4,6-dideoxygalactose transaminase
MYEIGQEEIDAVAAVIRSGQMFRYRGGEGGQVDATERIMREMIGCRYALTVTSGTGALICGLVGLGLGPGDEVIVPAYTWLASAGAILSVGAIPVLAEVDETLTLDPADFEKRIGPHTRAVIPVHMGGRPSDMDRILEIARRRGLKVLEDACQAIGGSYKGRRLGAIGDAGAFSFNQFKNIACGEGGAFLTSDRKVYERGLYYHDMGCSFRNHAGELSEPPFLGNTFRMNEVLGAILRVQFGRLDSILQRLRERRDWVLEAVRAERAPLAISPSADLAGDCGCNATFIFKTAQDRERVAARAKELNPACGLGSPIHSGLHVYTNWSVLLNRQGGHHPAMNPFLMKENQACRLTITADTCPRTLEILARTGALAINIHWTKDQAEDMARTLCRAAREALG